MRKLEELAERKEYEELVKDITPRKGTDEPFSSYKDQLGFGAFLTLVLWFCLNHRMHFIMGVVGV